MLIREKYRFTFFHLADVSFSGLSLSSIWLTREIVIGNAVGHKMLVSRVYVAALGLWARLVYTILALLTEYI